MPACGCAIFNTCHFYLLIFIYVLFTLRILYFIAPTHTLYAYLTVFTFHCDWAAVFYKTFALTCRWYLFIAKALVGVCV